MTNKFELMSVMAGAATSLFFEDMALKVITTTVAMVIGSTVAFFWRRYLIRKYKK